VAASTRKETPSRTSPPWASKPQLVAEVGPGLAAGLTSAHALTDRDEEALVGVEVIVATQAQAAAVAAVHRILGPVE
jgi:hypothetical protein